MHIIILISALHAAPLTKLAKIMNKNKINKKMKTIAN